MGVWNVLNLKIDILKIRVFVGAILLYIYGRLEYLSATDSREKSSWFSLLGCRRSMQEGKKP